jgi:hypothetical protein
MAADRIARCHAAAVLTAKAVARITAWLGQLSVCALAGLLGMPASMAQPVPGPFDISRIETVSKRPSVAVKSVQTTHAWHDGTAIRMLSLDPTLEAHFAAGVLPQERVLRPAGSTGRDAAAQVSPVLRDESGRPRSLPGGVVVVLKTPMDETGARVLISQAGAIPLHALSDRLWLVQGPVGLGSLRLANQLQAAGLFESAQPNWWMPRTLK